MKSISVHGARVAVPSGSTSADVARAIARALGTRDTVLGIRQGDDVYPLQIVAATPGSFAAGDYAAVLADPSGGGDAAGASAGGGGSESAAAAAAAAEAPLVFKLPGGRALSFVDGDLAGIYTLVTHTGIYGLDPHDIYDAVLIATDGGASMSFAQFQAYVRALIGSPDSEENFVVTRLLFGLFHAIDINSTGLVSSDDLTAVLVVSDGFLLLLMLAMLGLSLLEIQPCVLTLTTFIYIYLSRLSYEIGS